MPRSLARFLMLALASTALSAAPAVAQEAVPDDEISSVAEEAAAEAAEEAADRDSDPDSSTSDADAGAPPPDGDPDDSADEGDEGDASGDDAAPGEKPAPSRPSRRSVLAKGIDGGAIVVKARTKVTQRLLAPAKSGKKAKLLGSATKTARKAGTIRLTIKLNAAGRAFVKAGATKVTLKTVINPVKGRTKTTTRTITIVGGA